METYTLSKDLLLGVATAATQIEGGDKNNSWYEYSSVPSNIKDGTCSINANDHYKNYKEDILLMKKMHIQVYRMSIEWSRIEPKENEFDSEAMKHYIDEISFLKENGILPLVTLHHFSNPLWFEHKGGFLLKDSPDIFCKYVEYVVSNLGDLVSEYCTINEPNIYAVNSYLFGVWPPKRKSFNEAIKVLRNLAKSHIKAYNYIHSYNSSYKVGFANHLIDFVPKNKYNPFYLLETSVFKKGFQEGITNGMAYGKFSFPLGLFGRKKGTYYDFIGINFYTRNVVSHFSYKPIKDGERNDLGWDISPSSLTKLVEKYHSKYKKDIYITENGTADKEDKFRSKFIYTHLKAISHLNYVKRYYHWTFMDNFEWAEGESAKFGLVEYNYTTKEKTIRPSGYFYTDIIINHEVNDEMIKKYLSK